MKILGVNTSHDTTVAWVEDGEVRNVFEEERCRRSKYWSPGSDVAHDQVKLLAIDHYQLHQPDAVAFATYDRRQVNVHFADFVQEDRLLQKDLIQEFTKEQLSLERLKEIQKNFPKAILDISEDFLDADQMINESILEQINTEDVTVDFDINGHHFFHAVCASHLSPYDEAICITWDGGGSNCYHEDGWPGYQEGECIFHYKNEQVKPLFRRMTNHRFIDDLQNTAFTGWQDGELHCLEPHTETIRDCEVEFVSVPTNGMNFSNMSYALGCDDLGRAAGKVMGMASYGRLIPNVYNKHTVANMLEHDALDHSIAFIKKAIDMVPDCKNIVLSGGFSLNCTNNYKYLQAFPDHQFFVDPIPHDGGTAVGAAINLHRALQEDEDVSNGDS